jgi:hypothetical protein
MLPFCSVGLSDSVFQKFEFWGHMTDSDKLLFYWGWTNGLGVGVGGSDIQPLATCLEKLSTLQPVAMIDKYYREHPEHWSAPIGYAILAAVTVAGGPCEGKAPTLKH